MPHNSSEFVSDLEEKTSFYLKKLAQIDRILEKPVKTLLVIAHDWAASGASPPAIFPALIAERPESRKIHSPPTLALCCATLQRLSRLRRRFPWLEKNSYLDQVDKELIKEKFLPPMGSDFSKHLELFDSKVLGNLNPLSASYVLRVLLEAGEAEVHRGVGFLAFFAMTWPFWRQYPERSEPGARIEPWKPTSYVTASALLPIVKLQGLTTHRADLLKGIKDHLKQLADLVVLPRDERSNWLFHLKLDGLCADLRRLSRITDIRDLLDTLATTIGEGSDKLTAHSKEAEKICKDLRQLALTGLAGALTRIRAISAEGMKDVTTVLNGIKGVLLPLLEERAGLSAEQLRAKPTEELAKNKLGLFFAAEHLNAPIYWQDLLEAAKKALEFCEALQKIIADASTSSSKIDANDPKTIDDAIEELISANRAIAQRLKEERPLENAVRWCGMAMDREIANASAGNLTDFDPSELVSAIAVAVRCNLITTPLQVADAVKKALQGAREDGSWRLGLPFFSPDNVLGIWAASSSIVWALTSAIQKYPDVSVADDALFRYVDWLERTLIVFAPDGKTTNDEKNTEYAGWASDRLRQSQKIHIMTTAFSINALLEIRDLVEFRFWQLCQKRFTAVPVDKGLDAVDPVDLGAVHEQRLHTFLRRMTRDTQASSSAALAYSLILHGPPGSSKTEVAQALSFEMWKDSKRWVSNKEARFVRITPADFTRMGEDRLDSEARVIFELLSHVRGVTIFFDEIDDLLRKRPTHEHQPTFMELVVPAMLNRLADLRKACPRQEICFVLATNYIEHIEPALIRPGRIDRALPVVYPDRASRLAMLYKHIASVPENRRKRPKEVLEIVASKADFVLEATKGWPWLVIEQTFKRLMNDLPEAASAKEDEIVRIISVAIDENKGSFAKPRYKERIEAGRGSREFVNEVLHYFVCKDEVIKKGQLFDQSAFEGDETIPELKGMVDAMLKGEGREAVAASSA
jgi:hypothetical protein